MSKSRYYSEVWEASKKLGWTTKELMDFLHRNWHKNPVIVLKNLNKEIK